MNNNLLNQLTLNEKLQLLTGKDAWHTYDNPSLSLESIRMSDGPHGIRKLIDASQGSGETYKNMVFPTVSALATTWNPDLAYRMGEALADECRLMDVDVLLGPGTNIKRTPLCGRNFEYFSEDPYLSGKMTAQYIRGVQDNGVSTCLKHFAANNQEFCRMSINSEVDLRALHEIYFKPFEIAIKEGEPTAVMCAYNKLNGTFCSQNKWLLTDMLRDNLNFKGMVISDWWAVHDRSAALKAGLDLQMPYTEESLPNLTAAYEKGELTLEEIDEAATKVLTFIQDTLSSRHKTHPSISSEDKYQLAKEIACESMVLLKNEEHILPIDPNQHPKVALIGEYADQPFIQGGGSAKVNPTFVDSTVKTMQDLAPDTLEIDYARVYSTWLPVHDVENVLRGVESAKKADMAIVFVGNGEIVETESMDREHIKLKKGAEILIHEIAKVNAHTVVVVQSGSAVDMSSWQDEVQAIVLQGYAGCASGSALAEILLGNINPSGKLTESYPIDLEDCPAYEEETGDGMCVHYKEGIMVGYRYYDTYDKAIAFPFGFGLSYTTFDYQNLQIKVAALPTNESSAQTVPTTDTSNDSRLLEVSFEITNTGACFGKETTQLYAHYEKSSVTRPVHELKAFQKVSLAPGETQTVSLTLPLSHLAYFDVTTEKWVMNESEITVQVGASSRDIRLSKTIDL